MKTIAYILFTLFPILLYSQTTSRFYESFDVNNELGWLSFGEEVDLFVYDGKLNIFSPIDEIVQVGTPLGATMDDFSIKISGYGNCSGGFGRSGFNSFLAILIEDSISIVYTEDAQAAQGNYSKLFDYPIPDTITSLELKVSRSGNNLNINGYVNEILFYSGTLSNVTEDLFYGQMIMFLIKEDNPIQFELDYIDIYYNSYITPLGIFNDDFTNIHSPWGKFGDLEHTHQCISISNGQLNFNYSGSDPTELYVLSPVGAVKDFTIEVTGGAGGNHNCPFSISRFFNYRNYVTVFFEDDQAYLGYADDEWEPTIIVSAPVNLMNISKVKFASVETPTGIILTLWVNDALLLTGSIQNPSEYLKIGHLGFGFDQGNIVSASFNSVSISYTKFTDVHEISETVESFKLGQNYPNPFNPSTIINYTLPFSDYVLLKVYDLLGNEIKTLVNDYQNSGNYSIHFSAEGLATGIYFYRISTSNQNLTRKMLFLK
jgi:hypothetical protein